MDYIKLARDAGIEPTPNTVNALGKSVPQHKIEALCKAVRSAALEEAAQKCEDYHYEIEGSCKDAAYAIRALKETP